MFEKNKNNFFWRNLKFILVFILQRDHAEPIRLEDGAGYRCPFCLNDFKSHIKRHIRTHTGEKPYLCTQCHRTFSQLGTLKRHYQIKHS